MLTHEQILGLTMLDPHDGFIIAVDKDGKTTSVFHTSSINPEYRYLLATSGAMYIVLDAVQFALMETVKELEGMNKDELVSNLLDVTASVMTVKQFATEGLPNVAKRSEPRSQK